MNNRPPDWDDVALDDFGEIVAGGTPSRTAPSFWNGDIPWVTPSEITALKNKHLRETREQITREGLASSAAKLLPPGTLLVTSRATLGEVAIAGVSVTTNQGFKNIIPNEATDSLFAYYRIGTLKPELERRASGTTFLEISKADFSRIRTLRPNRAEQSRIATVLDTVDEAIAKTEAVIAKLKQVRAGLLHDLLTRGLDENGQLRDPIAHPEQFQDSPIGRIPRGWEATTLVSKISLPQGQVDPRVMPYAEWILIAPDHIEVGTGRLIATQTAKEQIAISGKYVFDLRRHEVIAGDLLVASMGDENHPLARACLYPANISPGIVKADCFRLRMKKSMAINCFVMLILNCPSTRREVNVLGQGVTRDRINLSTLLKLRVLRPSVEEQKQVVKLVDDLDIKIRNEMTLYSKLAFVKSALMADLLTGRVRVPASL